MATKTKKLATAKPLATKGKTRRATKPGTQLRKKKAQAKAVAEKVVGKPSKPRKGTKAVQTEGKARTAYTDLSERTKGIGGKSKAKTPTTTPRDYSKDRAVQRDVDGVLVTAPKGTPVGASKRDVRGTVAQQLAGILNVWRMRHGPEGFQHVAPFDGSDKKQGTTCSAMWQTGLLDRRPGQNGKHYYRLTDKGRKFYGALAKKTA